jgi:hypothetical protein
MARDFGHLQPGPHLRVAAAPELAFALPSTTLMSELFRLRLLGFAFAPEALSIFDSANPGPSWRGASDIYPLGATIHESLTADPPFYPGDPAGPVSGQIPSSMAQRRTELEKKGEPIAKNWGETVAACYGETQPNVLRVPAKFLKCRFEPAHLAAAC